MSFGTGFNAFASGLNGSVEAARDRKERSAAMQQNERMLDIMGGMPGTPRGLPQDTPSEPRTGIGGFIDNIRGKGQQIGETLGLREPDPAPGLDVNRAPTRIGGAEPGYQPPTRGPHGGMQGSLFDLLRQHEGAGDYDTLYGHSQREGGRFAGVKPTEMTLAEIDQFEKSYGPWVASKNNGVYATPVGAGQIVGQTRRPTAKALGYGPDTKFTPEVQDSMINYLAQQRLARANTMPEKLNQIRQEWVGFRNVPDDQLAAAIIEFESQGAGRGIRARR